MALMITSAMPRRVSTVYQNLYYMTVVKESEINVLQKIVSFSVSAIFDSPHPKTGIAVGFYSCMKKSHKNNCRDFMC